MGREKCVEWKITEQGPRIVVEVWRREDGEGLYKAWLTGRGGRMMLGTLIPEGGRLFLRRTLSVDSLKRQGVWPAIGVEEQLVCSFRAEIVGEKWEDTVLKRSARTMPRHSVSRQGDGFSLRFPFNPRAPFPITPLFCFARLVEGELVFSFYKGGWPYIFRHAGEDKEEINPKGRNDHGKPDHKGTGRAGGSAGL